jgi:hypothetical protein
MSDLSEQHKQFARNLLKHKFNAKQAYLETYPDCTPESAKAAASRLLTSVNLTEYLQELSERVENDDLPSIKEVLDDINEAQQMARDKDRANDVLKGAELKGKMIGAFIDKKEIKEEITGLNGEPISNKLIIEYVDGNENPDKTNTSI